MLKLPSQAIFAIFFILTSAFIARADNPTAVPPQFDKLDDIGILRMLYPKQSLIISDPKDESPGRQYQVGEVQNHKIAVLARVTGKFTQVEKPEMLAMVGVETGGDTDAPVATGIYALLLQLDKQGSPQLIARSSVLQRKLAPFTGKFWRPVIVTDLDFDKEKRDDLIMLEGDSRNGKESYSLYRWEGKDFAPIPDHPALALLSFYAHLDAAAHLGLGGDDATVPGTPQLAAAYEKLSPKLQGQQSVDSLRRRLQESKGVEIDNLKMMIRSETSALVRVQYRLVKPGGIQQFEGDYQIRRFNSQWQLDSERLKVITPTKPEIGLQPKAENFR